MTNLSHAISRLKQLQYLIDKDYDISCCINKQGWYEVDTLQDLDNLKSKLGVSNDRK